ncbi:MAG: sigma-70 family RNA polymerase sigma factor [Alphaproteobacteria bacterium]|nr:sigma-70 family RNA polymerase sigma factor [Alphaproteobacteria bacterium]
MFSQDSLVSEIPRLQKFALRLTRKKADADDLVQMTCLRALEKSDYFEDGSNLFSWTATIMYNIFVSAYRRRTKFETQYDPNEYIDRQAVAPAQDHSLQLSEVRSAMKRLSSDHSQIIMMVCIKGMRYDEAGEILQIPTGTVRSRLSRARKQLQELMEDSYRIRITQDQTTAKEDNQDMAHVPAYIISRIEQMH